MNQLINDIVKPSRRRFFIFCGVVGVLTVAGTAGVVHGMSYVRSRALAGQKPLLAEVVDAFAGVVTSIKTSTGAGFVEVASIPVDGGGASDAAALPIVPASAPAKKSVKRSTAQTATQTAASEPVSEPVKPKIIGAADTSPAPVAKAVSSPAQKEPDIVGASPGTAAKPKPPRILHPSSAVADAPSQQDAQAVCGYDTTASPTHSQLVLNEIAWAGTEANVSNEWFELKNISGSELDVSNWQIVDKEDQIHVTFGSQTKIPASGLVLFERTDDESVPGTAADIKYVGALGNTDEGLRLFNANCQLVDEALASPAWPAGDSATKKSMERASDFGWYTYTGDGVSGIFGTPRLENSAPPAGGSTPDSSQTTSSMPSNPPPTTPPPATLLAHIVISEVLYNATGSDTGKEFVELYNPANSDQSVDGWLLQLQSGGGSMSSLGTIGSKPEDVKVIKAGGFLLVGLSGYIGTADVKRSASLPNSASIIYLKDNSDHAIDSVAYLGTEPEGSSLERKAMQSGSCVSAAGAGELLGNGCDTDNASDFELRATPNPQNSSGVSEPGA